VRIGLRWKGRFDVLEGLGLPVKPPGKMFKGELIAVPLPKEKPRHVLEHGTGAIDKFMDFIGPGLDVN
jgi:hypothetical protein